MTKKRNSIFLITAPVIALFIGGSVVVWNMSFNDTAPKNVSENVLLQEPQCAHWSILRCCQLLGAPVTLKTLLELLPYQEEGHSMFQMTEVLHKIGFETEGRRENLFSLANGTFPCIAHLTNSNSGHFIVVSGIDDDYVHVFDGNGHRTARERKNFDSQWNGEILRVKKPANSVRFPAFLPPAAPNTPQIQFDHLIVDLGTVPSVGEPVQFEFPFRNTGTADLEIADVRPECSCIKKEISSSKIAPEKTGSIKLSYHVQPDNGTFLHDILVTTNDPQLSGVLLNASGWSGAAVTIHPPTLAISGMMPHQEKRVHHVIRYSGESGDFRVRVAEKTLNNIELLDSTVLPFTAELWKKFFPATPLKEERELSKLHLLEFVLRSEANIGDMADGKIVLETNVKGYEKIALNLRAVIIPPVKAYPEIVVLNDSQNSETITLVTQSDDSFRILDITPKRNDIRLSYTPNTWTKESQILVNSAENSTRSSVDEAVYMIQIESEKNRITYDYPVRVMLE
jgi:hypothetical protein